MTPSADFFTLDVYQGRGLGGARWRRAANGALRRQVSGLRAATVNWVNDGTRSLVPKGFVGGGCLVAAWDSPEAAAAAWRGPLREVVAREGRFSLDGEVVRVRLHEDGHHWHGWHPSAEGARPLETDEAMVAVVHSVLRRNELFRFIRNNLHAASRAAHHPGHRGSVDVSSQLPFEHTSISLWRSLELARDFAYKPGGHLAAMQYSLDHDTHRMGCFLQVRPLRASGALGLAEPAFPDLPPAIRR